MKNIYLIGDAETTGLPPFNLIFDWGYVIADNKKIIVERSFLVREVLCNGRVMLKALHGEDWRTMMGAKVFTTYIPAIAKRHMRIFGWREILETMRDDMLTHNVNRFCAYNLRFDMTALSKTQNFVTGERKVLSQPCDLLDLWLCCCQYVFNSRLYHETAIKNNWIGQTAAKNVRTTAEHAYRFLTGDHSFIEAHTGLQDARIETEILWRILAKKQRLPINDIQANPWQRAQKIRGTLLHTR